MDDNSIDINLEDLEAEQRLEDTFGGCDYKEDSDEPISELLAEEFDNFVRNYDSPDEDVPF